MLEVVSGARFCVNCRYYRASPRGHETAHVCDEPHSSALDLVTGRRVGVGCREQRAPGAACGLDGLNYQPKAPGYPHGDD